MRYLRPIPSTSSTFFGRCLRISAVSLLGFSSLLTSSEAQSTSQLPAAGQSVRKEGDEVIRISTNLVQVDVIVTDSKGNHIDNLTESDFALEVDGKAYPISFFRSINNAKPEAPKPSGPALKAATLPFGATKALAPGDIKRTIALIIDDAMAFESFVRTKESLKKFVAQQMEDGDLVAIVRTGVNSNLLGKFTTDRQMLAATIERLSWRPPMNDLGTLPGLSDAEQLTLNNTFEAYNTSGRVNSMRLIARSLRDLPGRKVGMLFSDGFRLGVEADNRVLEQMRRLVDEAHRGGVTFYAISTTGLEDDGPGLKPITFSGSPMGQRPSNDVYRRAADRRVYLREGPFYLARETGGLATINSNDVFAGIRKSLDDNRSYYLVGFDPEDDVFNGRFRALKVKVLKKGLEARTRSGFLGKADTSTKGQPRTRTQEITDALFSPFLAREIPLALSAMFFTTSDRQPVVRASIHFDCTMLMFQPTEGEKKATTLELVAITFDDNGNPADQQERNFTVSLDGPAMKQVLEQGLVYQADFNAPKPGVYQMRAVLREPATGKLGTAFQTIQIPDLSKGKLSMSGIFLAGSPASTKEFVGLRQYALNSELQYAALVYSPVFDAARKAYQLTSHVEIVKAGKVIHQTPPRPVDAGDQQVPELQVGGRLQLTGLEPGDYFLQLVVTDALAGNKGTRVGQWVDFSVR